MIPTRPSPDEPEAARETNSRPSRRRSAGQALVEFALLVPILVLMFVAVADFARLYTTMTTIEAAAREAADYGSFSSAFWTDPATTRAAMVERACTASMDLPDYEPKGGDGKTCTNPEVVPPTPELITTSSPDGRPCHDALREVPCRVRVTLEYDFRLILPLHVSLFDFQFGFPTQLTFQRTSVFAISDLTMESQAPIPSTTPAPTPTPEPVTPSPSVEVSPSPEISPSAELSPSPAATPSPEATPTPFVPTPTPVPTPSPTPSASVEPSAPPVEP